MSKALIENHKPNFKDGEIIVIDKEKGWSSFAVVRKIKIILKTKLDLKKIKVGHAGTLDPLATGLLIICTGKATKTISKIQSSEKEYLATIKLGATTPSYDLETDINKTFPISHISEKKFRDVLKKFTGNIQQAPPLYSAVWHNGKRAYKYARAGKEIDLGKRDIFIRKIDLEKFFPPYATISTSCNTGTYIRSLANDIGEALDSGAFLYYLRRIRSGDFTIDDAIKIDELENFLNKM